MLKHFPRINATFPGTNVCMSPCWAPNSVVYLGMFACPRLFPYLHFPELQISFGALKHFPWRNAMFPWKNMFAWVLVEPLICLFILVDLHVPDYSRIYTFLSCKYHLEHWHIFLEEMQCFHENICLHESFVEPLICLFILVDLHVPDYSRIYTFLSHVLKGQPPVLLSPIGQFDSE